jgi:hypothetical protein
MRFTIIVEIRATKTKLPGGRADAFLRRYTGCPFPGSPP